MKKIPEGVKVYPLTSSQSTEMKALLCSIHKSVVQIPFYMITGKKIDFELMRDAIKEEIKRNDCLRLAYYKKGINYFQYFLPEKELPEIPFQDFAGFTDRDMMAWLEKDAGKMVKFDKGEPWRMKFFRTPDGRSGVYINVTHASMDLFAVFSFFKDLMEVYDAMEKGTEMPRPLSRFEDVMQKEFARAADTEKMQQHKDFYKAYFGQYGHAFYAGIDSMRQLNALRKKKKDPDLFYISGIDPFHDKTERLTNHISKQDTEQMQSYCLENGVTLSALIYMGIRTWLSRHNDYTRDVHVSDLLNRRATLAEKRCGGCMMNPISLRTVLDEETTFAQAVQTVTNVSREMMRHCDLSVIDVDAAINEIEHRKIFGSTTASLLYTVVPHGAFVPPEGWDVEVGVVTIGYYIQPMYMGVMPNLLDGGMDVYYEYRTHLVNREEMQDFFDSTMKVLKAGMHNPDITVGQLLREVLK